MLRGAVRVTKANAKKEFKLSDADINTLLASRGYIYADVRALARKVHGGDRGTKAMVDFSRNRVQQLREARSNKYREKDRIRRENVNRKRVALLTRLEESGVVVPEMNQIFHDFVVEGPCEQEVYNPNEDPQLIETVERLRPWDLDCKERRTMLPSELQKHGLHYSDETLVCKAYVDQSHYRKVSLRRVVRELTEAKWFFEHTNYQQMRFADAQGHGQTYWTDYNERYDPAFDGELPSTFPTTEQTVGDAREEVIEQIVEKRFAAGNKAPVTRADEPFGDALASIIDKANTEIEYNMRPGGRRRRIEPDSASESDEDLVSDLDSGTATGSSAESFGGFDSLSDIPEAFDE